MVDYRDLENAPPEAVDAMNKSAKEWHEKMEKEAERRRLILRAYRIDLEWIIDDINDEHISGIVDLKHRLEYLINKIKREIAIDG
jgi:hypothetical protein